MAERKAGHDWAVVGQVAMRRFRSFLPFYHHFLPFPLIIFVYAPLSLLILKAATAQQHGRWSLAQPEDHVMRY